MCTSRLTNKGVEKVSAFKLIKFECKKQITSFTFLIILLLFTIFAITQLTEVFHMPVNSESDIQALLQSGERDYIFVANPDAVLKNSTIEFLQQRISEGTILEENSDAFDPVFKMLLDDSYTFDDVFSAMKDDEFVFPWLGACKSQFGERLGTVDEVNGNMQEALRSKGYSPNLYAKYVTYMQAIAAFLIFPLFLLLLTRDYRHNMYEVIYSQPLSHAKYILCRYLGIFLPLIAYLYLFGLLLNLISVSRFVGAGYEFSYTPFITYFAVYLLPTIFFLSSLIMVLMLLINKTVAVFPIYIIYILFNITPDVFSYGNRWIRIINPVIRLDREVAGMEVIAINRIVYTILGIILLIIACKVYKKIRHNLRRNIAI